MTLRTTKTPRVLAWGLALTLPLGLGLLGLLAGPAAAQSSPPAPTDLSCSLPSNCVSSVGGGGLEALRFEGTPEQALAALERTLADLPEARVVNRYATQLEVVFTTFLGFRDEVLFRVDAAKQRIDFRSRSLMGLYDFGKNRSRMKDFAARFEAQRQAK